MINTILVDDHQIFLDSLEAFIHSTDDMKVVAKYSSGVEFTEKMDLWLALDPDVILLDLKMNNLSGLKCMDIMNERKISVSVIVLSMFDHSPFIYQSLKKGAKGYITKDANPDELLRAIRMVARTGYYINASLSKTLVLNITEKQKATLILNPVDLITPTEFEVLQHICQGFTAEEMGKTLYRSKRTIEGHRQKLLEKTGTKNVAALVAWAFREGLVT